MPTCLSAYPLALLWSRLVMCWSWWCWWWGTVTHFFNNWETKTDGYAWRAYIFYKGVCSNKGERGDKKIVSQENRKCRRSKTILLVCYDMKHIYFWKTWTVSDTNLLEGKTRFVFVFIEQQVLMHVLSLIPCQESFVPQAKQIIDPRLNSLDKKEIFLFFWRL